MYMSSKQAYRGAGGVGSDVERTGSGRWVNKQALAGGWGPVNHQQAENRHKQTHELSLDLEPGVPSPIVTMAFRQDGSSAVLPDMSVARSNPLSSENLFDRVSSRNNSQNAQYQVVSTYVVGGR